MSFRCDECLEAQPAGQTPHQVVTKTRQAEYTLRSGGGLGWEIAEQKNLCDVCVGWVENAGEAARAAATAHVSSPPGTVEYLKTKGLAKLASYAN